MTLRINLSDLLGQPVLMEDQKPSNDDVPAIRTALMSHRRLSQTLLGAVFVAEVVPQQIAKLSEFAWQDYQKGRLRRVIGALPGLIKSAQALQDASASPENLHVSARIHHLAATALSRSGKQPWHGSPPSGQWQQPNSPEIRYRLPSASRAGTHALLAVGRTMRCSWAKPQPFGLKLKPATPLTR